MKVYLDHHATTPCDPRVVQAMAPCWSDAFGNAGSRGHSWGRMAAHHLDRAREEVARRVGGEAREIVFTSGATEANNLAILGTLRASGSTRRGFVTVATEHPSVLEAAAAARIAGHPVDVLPVDGDGRLDPERLAAAVDASTALVSVMAVNNEIGTIQPIADLAAVARRVGARFHCDAVQAGALLPIDVAAWDVDLLSLSAHKMHGPMGVGALWVRRRPAATLVPVALGGGQERGLRSGTVAVPLAVGFGASCTVALEAMAAGAAERVGALRDRLERALVGALSDTVVHGGHRAPHNLHVAFEGVDGPSLLAKLRTIAASSGSACASADLRPSHVLTAIGAVRDGTWASLRFGLARTTTEEEVDYVAVAVIDAVVHLRRERAQFGG